MSEGVGAPFEQSEISSAGLLCEDRALTASSGSPPCVRTGGAASTPARPLTTREHRHQYRASTRPRLNDAAAPSQRGL